MAVKMLLSNITQNINSFFKGFFVMDSNLREQYFRVLNLSLTS